MRVDRDRITRPAQRCRIQHSRQAERTGVPNRQRSSWLASGGKPNPERRASPYRLLGALVSGQLLACQSSDAIGTLYLPGDNTQLVVTTAVTGPAGLGGCNGIPEQIALTGEILDDTELCAEDENTIYGGLRVGDGLILRIQAGTTVIVVPGSSELSGSIRIEPGARIEAEGTADAPITFTTTGEDPTQGGQWDGLLIHGDAPGFKNTEGDPEDSSGVLSYVRFWYGGGDSEGAKAAVSFINVGSGTQLDHLYVDMARGPAYRFSGGTAELSYSVTNRTLRHGVYWINGFQGRISNLLVTDAGHTWGVWGLNRARDPFDDEPLSEPIVHNVTVMGSRAPDVSFSRGSGGHIINSMFVSNSGCVMALSDDATDISGDSISFRNILVHDATAGVYCLDSPDYQVADPSIYVSGLIVEDPLLDGYLPAADSPALDPANADQDYSDYIGAFSTEDWTRGWASAPPGSGDAYSE